MTVERGAPHLNGYRPRRLFEEYDDHLIPNCPGASKTGTTPCTDAFYQRSPFGKEAVQSENLHRERLLTLAPAIAISTPPGTTSGLLALDGNRQMTGSTRSSGGLDDRRKRLLFRCWHRGTREMDLILGRFADAEIAGLSEDELAQLELLIEVPDPDLYAAVSGDGLLAPEFACELFDRIKAFRPADHA
jgi:antitoxin CptB